MKPFHPNILFYFLFWAIIDFPLFGEPREIIFYDAVRAEASGDLEKAIEIYTTLSEKSHSASLHANLAYLFFKVEDYAKAVLHFRKAIWIDPGNRDYEANLSLALEMCGVAPKNLPESVTIFSPRFQTLILIILSIFVWSGVLALTHFFRLPVISKKPFWIGALWLLGSFILSWIFIESVEHTSRLNREIIAIHSLAQKNETENTLALRVFAGNGSSANTQIALGSSLFLDLGEDGLPRVHKSPNGEKWYLARSFSGSDKGWIQRNEFEPILDLEL